MTNPARTDVRIFIGPHCVAEFDIAGPRDWAKVRRAIARKSKPTDAARYGSAMVVIWRRSPTAIRPSKRTALVAL